MRPFTFKIEEITQIVRPVKTAGSFHGQVTGVASLDKAQGGDLSFLGNSQYEKYVATSKASVLLLPENLAYTPKGEQLALFVKKPSLAFAQICERIERLLWPKPAWGIHPMAVIDREANVHPETYIGPMCIIESGAQIHKGAVLHAQVYVGSHATIGSATELKAGCRILNDCEIGARCILHSGVVIGSDGFGFEFSGGKHLKVPQIGKVVVEDDVEIGANTTIDRARFGVTRVGEGSKIDNLVQIGHNANIGKHCILVAQAAIAGSSTLGDYVVIGGQAGVVGHITIGSQTQVAAKAGVTKSIPEKQIISGHPADDLRTMYRIEALKRRLPELFERVEKVEEKIKGA